MKKKAAIVFGITDNYVFALANVLLGMKKHCVPFWDDIIVYHTGVSRESIDNINKILKCEFIEYQTNKIVSKVNGNSLKSYSLLCMARFECFDLLKEYEYVIWHDVDILIQKDFSALIECGKESGFALTCDPTYCMEQNFFKVINEYEMMTPLYNSGIMVINDRLPDYERLTQYCYDKFNQYGEIIRYFDQAVLNMLIQDFDIEVGYIDLDTYCCHPSKNSSKTAVIVHAYGSEKFWNTPDLQVRYPEWKTNNDKWLKLLDQYTEEEKQELKYDLENPKVSVVMSVYKRTEFLDDSIKSILNQSFTNFEFIIVLEYSDEQKAIKEYIDGYKDERIRVICNEKKLGFAASLNVGLDMARGQYIARMDDDDISMQDRFKKEVEYLDSHPDVTVVGSYIRMFMNSTELCKVPADIDEIKVRALTETPLYHPTVMMRKKDIDENNFRYDTKYFTEDYELWCRMLDKVKISNIQEVLLLYRASGKNATAQHTKEVWKSHTSIVKRNFKQNLDVDLTDDEVYLIEKPWILGNCYNTQELEIIRQDAIDRIKHANSVKKVYDKDLLDEKLKTYKPSFLIRMKRRLTKVPVLLFMGQIAYAIVAKDGKYSYLFHKDVAKL